MDDKDFIDISLSVETLDIFYHRKAILKVISRNLPILNGALLDVGCGKMPYKKYILSNSNISSYTGLDIEGAIIYDKSVKPDFYWNGVTMPFENESFECAFATEVLEHCPYPDITLKEVYRVLKPKGCFLFTVPFLWNLHEIPYDYYRYTPFSLHLHLQNVGFTNIEVHALGGWHASLAQMIGLWLRRAPMNARKRKVLSILSLPFYKKLIKTKFDPKNFHGTMITGLTGIAFKK